MGEQESKGLQSLKQTLILELEKRVKDKILENENKEILAKLISNADSITEAQAIMALGTTYKRTGFHFDKRLEKSSDKIFYFKKNEELSFSCDFWNKQGEGVKGEAEAVEMRNCGFQARNKGVTKAVMTEVEGEESTIYRSKQAKSEVSLVNATPLKHTLIIGDNYPALQNLLITYKEKVKVIYIDPPYGKDDLGEFAKTNYHNAITRDNLLSMLYPRLQLAKELLKDDGVIFCSIDDKNQAYVKCLFDEVFGEGNFVSNLVWQKKKGGSQDSKHFAKEHETILCYQKREWDINDIKQEQDEKDFTKIINGKRAKILKLEKWGVGALRTDAPSLHYPIKDPNGEDFYPIAPNGQDGRWRKKPENLDSEHIFWQKDSKGRLTPYEVIYFDEVLDKQKVMKTRTIFTEFGTTTDAAKEIQNIFGDKIFDYPKPMSLIKHLLKISTTPNTQTQATKEQFTGPPPPPPPPPRERKKKNILYLEDDGA